MKKELTINELVKKLADLYIARFNALEIENNHKKGNRLELQFTKIEEQLILTKEGINAMTTLLDHPNEIIRYYSSCTLLPIHTKKCTKNLIDLQKNSKNFRVQAEYALLNFNEGNNYFDKFLKENTKS